MIPQDRHQPGPPGRVTVWGYPWHGLVEDGVLTLPNAATMPHPGTVSTLGEADVLALVVPGTPPVSRTPAQAAADAAAGRQWLDYALISGRYQRHLYGQVIGGNGTWLYVAPDGSRWRATLAGVPGTHDLTTPWATTVTLERFGALGAAAESHDLAVSLADWQQAVPGHPGGDYALEVYGAVTSARVEVEDVRRDGSAALLGVSINASNETFWAGFEKEPLVRRLIGTVEMTLTGTPGVDAAAALAVRHTRAQAIGTIVESGSDTYVTWYHNGDDLLPEDYGVWSQTQWSSTDCTAVVGTGTYSIQRTGRILAAGYDAAGAVREITLDIEVDASASAPQPPDGPSTSRSTSSQSTLTITLSGPGGSVVLSGTSAFAEQQSFTSGTGSQGESSFTLNTTIGPESDAQSGSGDLQGPGDLFPHMADPSVDTFFLEGYIDNVVPFRSEIHLAPDTGQDWLGAIRRYSATCLELLLVVWDRDTNTYEAWHNLGAVSIAGNAGGLITTPTIHPGGFYSPFFGTAHPVTGAIERVRDVPVIWV